MSARLFSQLYLERRARPPVRASSLFPTLAGAVLLCALVMSACSPSSTAATRPAATPTSTTPAKWVGIQTPTPPPTPDSSPHPLPAFSDWRLVYLGPDGMARVVSLDGRIRLIGAALPINQVPDAGIWTAKQSPDGRHIAYSDGNYFYLVDLQAGVTHSVSAPGAVAGDMFWSSRQQYVAEVASTKRVDILDVSQGSIAIIPKPGNQMLIGSIYGWLDSQHMAVGYIPDMSPTAEPLESLNVATGAVQPIFIMRSPLLGAGRFSLLPGGRLALFYNKQIQSDPYTPNVGVVNTTNGVFTHLPTLTHICSTVAGFAQILWRPGSTQAIVTTDESASPNQRYLLIDVAHDTATMLTIPGFPQAWTPDGQSVIVSTDDNPIDMENGVGWGDVGDVGSGPFTLTRVTFDANWKIASSVTLATDAMNIPVLGFTHTA